MDKLPKKNDLSFVEFVVTDQLSNLDIEAKRMFGGHGLYFKGYFFGLISRGFLYFKTTEKTRQPYLDAGMGPFQPSPRQTLKNYFQVPIDVIEDADELTQWAKTAIATQKAD